MSEPIPEWATDFDSWMRRLAAARIEDREEPKFWDEAAIDLLLSEIDERHWSKPLDRGALASELERAKVLYEMWYAAFDRRPTGKKLRDRAEKICRLCERLIEALPRPDALTPCPDEPPGEVFGQLMFQTADDVEKLRSTISNLRHIEQLTDRLAKLPEPQKETASPNTANDWLIGKKLPGIFEHHFTSRPRGRSYAPRKQTPAGGPAIRFNLTALKIMKVKNSKHRAFGPEGIGEIWERSKTWKLDR
jgi:hypothetical protein